MKRIYKIVLGLLFVMSTAFSQLDFGIFPKQFEGHTGITVISYKKAPHHSTKYYDTLFRMLCKQLSCNLNDYNIVVYIIPPDVPKLIEKSSPGFLEKDWIGYFFPPNVIVMTGEVDIEFFHEAMHYLQRRDNYLADLDAETAHRIIYANAALMVLTPDYLDFLKSNPK